MFETLPAGEVADANIGWSGVLAASSELRVAVVTTCFSEGLTTVRRCRACVLAPTPPVTHFMVADGEWPDEVDGWDVVRVRLASGRADYGDPPPCRTRCSGLHGRDTGVPRREASAASPFRQRAWPRRHQRAAAGEADVRHVRLLADASPVTAGRRRPAVSEHAAGARVRRGGEWRADPAPNDERRGVVRGVALPAPFAARQRLDFGNTFAWYRGPAPAARFALDATLGFDAIGLCAKRTRACRRRSGPRLLPSAQRDSSRALRRAGAA